MVNGTTEHVKDLETWISYMSLLPSPFCLPNKFSNFCPQFLGILSLLLPSLTCQIAISAAAHAG